MRAASLPGRRFCRQRRGGDTKQNGGAPPARHVRGARRGMKGARKMAAGQELPNPRGSAARRCVHLAPCGILFESPIEIINSDPSLNTDRGVWNICKRRRRRESQACNESECRVQRLPTWYLPVDGLMDFGPGAGVEWFECKQIY